MNNRIRKPLNNYDMQYILGNVSADKQVILPGAPSEPNEYNFNFKRRGIFVIINNKHFAPETHLSPREGTDNDAERLEESFQDLEFDVKRFDNVCKEKMVTIMQNAALFDHTEADCFGCAILSYGAEGYVYGTDGPVTLEILSLPLKGEKCRSLVGKPKLFFMQTCQETEFANYERHLSPPLNEELLNSTSSNIHSRRIPAESDFLFAYSTVPGSFSWSNSQEGSWFIQALCIVLENYGTKMELLQMLTHINRIVAYEFVSCTDKEFTDAIKQHPCFVSMLTRCVHFKPKKQDIR